MRMRIKGDLRGIDHEGHATLAMTDLGAVYPSCVCVVDGHGEDLFLRICGEISPNCKYVHD